MEALSDGAVKMGIPRAVSLEIAAQVMKGAGELYLHNKLHPGSLKDMVCSPGGTYNGINIHSVHLQKFQEKYSTNAGEVFIKLQGQQLQASQN